MATQTVQGWIKSAEGRAATLTKYIAAPAAQADAILTAPFVKVEHPELAIDRATRSYWILGAVALTVGAVVLATSV
jgi:hypothetical protein